MYNYNITKHFNEFPHIQKRYNQFDFNEFMAFCVSQFLDFFFFTLCLNRKQSMSLHVQDKVSNGEISVIRAQNKITMMIRNS